MKIASLLLILLMGCGSYDIYTVSPDPIEQYYYERALMKANIDETYIREQVDAAIKRAQNEYFRVQDTTNILLRSSGWQPKKTR